MVKGVGRLTACWGVRAGAAGCREGTGTQADDGVGEGSFRGTSGRPSPVGVQGPVGEWEAVGAVGVGERQGACGSALFPTPV